MFHVETKVNIGYFNAKKFFGDFTKELFYSRRLGLEGRTELAERLLYVNQERIFSGKDVADLKKSTIFRKRHESSHIKPLVDTGGLLDSLKAVVGKKGHRDITLHFAGVTHRGIRYNTLARWITEGRKKAFIGQRPKSGKYFVFWGKAFPTKKYKGYAERKGTGGKGQPVVTSKRTFHSPAMVPRRLLLNDKEIKVVIKDFFGKIKPRKEITVESILAENIPVEKAKVVFVNKVSKPMAKAQREAFDHMIEEIGKGG